MVRRVGRPVDDVVLQKNEAAALVVVQPITAVAEGFDVVNEVVAQHGPGRRAERVDPPRSLSTPWPI